MSKNELFLGLLLLAALRAPAIASETNPPSAVSPVQSRPEIEAGLKSHDRALLIKPGWIRDPFITHGPDDNYYLTGTTPAAGDAREMSDPYNTGLGKTSIVGSAVRMWRSKDLIDWEELGSPFTLERDSFRNPPGKLVWAPELHWLGSRWALVHCPAEKANFSLSAGAEPKGPWTHPLGDRLGRKHDLALFQDGNLWWMIWGNGDVAPLSDDLTRFTAAPARIDPSGSRTNKSGLVKSVIGHEGATIIKVGGRYVFIGTAWSTDEPRKGSYNLYYCTAEKITGPYGPRRFLGRFLGHGTPFQTRDGQWWCTAFFNANVPPLRRPGIERRDLSDNAQTINQLGTTIVPLAVRTLVDGDVFLQAQDPAYAKPGPDEVQKFGD